MQIVAIAAFLRVINALENIRQSVELLEATIQQHPNMRAEESLKLAVRRTDDSIRVLECGGLHPEAVAHLKEARNEEREAARSRFFRGRHARRAIRELQEAKGLLVES